MVVIIRRSGKRFWYVIFVGFGLVSIMSIGCVSDGIKMFCVLVRSESVGYLGLMVVN